MKNKHWRCEVCDAPQWTDCGCFCDCWLPHSQCMCDMTPEDWELRDKQINNLKNKYGKN